MKKLLLLLALSCTLQSVAQDPRLYENTWYLYEVLLDDSSEGYEVYLIDPPIAPYLNISETLYFSGQGACNAFGGRFAVDQSHLTAIDFINTTNTCEFPVHNGFESEYFGFLSLAQGYDYNIVD